MFASEALPDHLKVRYNILIDGLHDLQDDYEQYKRESIPTWYTVGRYVSEMNLTMNNLRWPRKPVVCLCDVWSLFVAFQPR
jgi:hypothetical protein